MSEYDDQLTTTTPPRRRRGVALAAAGVLLVGTLGAGAWAATQFLGGGGPQPASALPADTLAVLSLDLDPSLGQKVQARDFVRRFPGLKGKGAGSGGDVRKVVWNWLDLDCKQTGFAQAEPWLGDRAAVAAVPHGKKIETVVVVEVTDQAKAKADVPDLGDCHGHAGPEDPDHTEVAFVGDYLVASDAQGLAATIAKDAKTSSLADTSAYRDWTERAGGHGLLTGYLAKAAPGRFLDQTESMAGDFGEEFEEGEVEPPMPSSTEMPAAMQARLDACHADVTKCAGLHPDFCEDEQECIEVYGPKSHGPNVTYSGSVDSCDSDSDCDQGECSSEEACEDLEPFDSDATFDKLRALYQDFEGAAVSVRFDDGDLTAHASTRGFKTGGFMFMPVPGLLAKGGTTPVGNLPGDTAIALSTAFADGWATSYLDGMTAMMVPAGAAQETPSRLAQDIEAIFGKSASLSVGADVTEQALESPQEHRGAEIGIRIVGDPRKIEPALRRQMAKDAELKGLVIVPGDGVVAAGFNARYVGRLATGGALGKSARFQGAVVDADKASMVLYADLDAGKIAQLVADTFGVERADVEPLDTFGYSQASDDDGYVHGRLLLRTD